MKKGICLLIVLLSFYSIKTRAQKKPNKECLNAFEQDVKKNWKYDEKGKCYITEEAFLYKLSTKYSRCMKGVDTVFIYNIMGRTNATLNNVNFGKTLSVTYLSKQGYNGSWELYFDFDEKGKIKSISYTILHINYDD